MRKIYQLIPSFLLICFVLISGTAGASHVMGGDLSYKCLGNNQYEITLKLYRDCSGISAPTTATATLRDSCSGLPTTISLPQVGPASGIDVTPLCPNFKQCNKCNFPTNPPASHPCMPPTGPGILQGVELYTYTTIITLPSNCPTFTIGYSLNARNAASTNLQNPGSQNLYIEAYLKANAVPCNTSPNFSELPTPYICQNQLYNYNHGAIEPDGDSLVYTFVNPLTGPNNPIAYASGYSITNPLSTTSGFQFNTKNGQITFTPSGVQVAVMTVKVCEYRQGTLVGCTMRDLQVVVIDCPSTQAPPEPAFGGIATVGGGGYLLDTTSIGICPNNPLSFTIVGVDNNSSDSVYVTSNISTAIPGATYTVSGNNPTTATFNWTPTIADTGFHYFTVTFKDNHCPVTSSQTYSYSIFVLNETKASEDVVFCPIGGPVKLSARGGSAFKWKPQTGIVSASGPDSSWIMVLPTITTNYIVSSDCDINDTVKVTVVPDFTYTKFPDPDTTICRYQTTPLNIIPDPVYGPYTYDWSPGTKLSDSTQGSITAGPLQTTTYSVTIESQLGCKITDSITVNISGEAPIVNMTATKEALCPDPTDQTQFNVIATPVACGANTTGCSGPTNNYSIGKGATSTAIGSPFRGNYEKMRAQYLYKASELKALGVIGGTITKLSFNVSNKVSSKPYKDFTIRMTCTGLNSLPNSFQGDLIEVFTPKAISTTAGWNTFTLDLPYDWDGNENILIEICYSNDNNATFDDEVYTSNTTFASVLYYLDKTPVINGCELLTALPAKFDRPNAEFTICNQNLNVFDISWIPTTGLSDTTVGNPILTSAGLPQTTTYEVTLDNQGCKGKANITIIKDPSTISVSNDTLICDQQPVQLTANITGNPPTMKLNCGSNGTATLYPGTSYQVASGSSNHQGTPFSGFQEDMRYQILYLASDLQVAGLKEGIITEFELEVAGKFSTNSMSNFTIKMGCTPNKTLTTSGWEAATNVVYTSSSYSTVAGWNKFTFNNGYDWDGVSNIVVEICWDNPNGSPLNNFDNLLSEVVFYKATARSAGTNSVGCNLPSPVAVYDKLPNSKFTVVPPPPGTFGQIWTPGFTLDDSTSLTPIATPNVTTTYIITANSEYNCVLKDTVTIDVSILIPVIDPDANICDGEEVTINVSGGTNYTWNPPVGINPTSGPTVVAKPAVTTTYTVTITDNGGCSKDTTITITVNTPPTVDAGADDSLRIGESLTLSPSSPNSISTYTWTPPLFLSNPNSQNPISTPAKTITYYLEVVDVNGCRAYDSVTIDVRSVDDIYIPTAFSPNGDGFNDQFVIYPVGITEIIEFQIFNRWGQMVYQSKDFSKGWDGKFQGQEQPVGTYIYKFVGKKYDGSILNFNGNITLLR